MAYVDFHVHVDYYKDYLTIFHEYERRGIYALFVTNLPEIYESCLRSFPESKYVKIAMGYNPMLANEYQFNKKIFDEYFSSVNYIGEVGLDYTKEFLEYKDKQLEAFQYIAKRCSGTQKILSVHSRNAVEDILSILEKHDITNVVFHWYTGNEKFITRILTNGYYFSVNPSMLRSKKGRAILKMIPLNSMLFESDGPFGKLNNNPMNPEYIELAYHKLGEFLEVDDLRSIIMKNFRRLLLNKDNNN